jgi:hypothetical protein
VKALALLVLVVLVLCFLEWNIGQSACPPIAHMTVIQGPRGPLVCAAREDLHGAVLECRAENLPPCR